MMNLESFTFQVKPYLCESDVKCGNKHGCLFFFFFSFQIHTMFREEINLGEKNGGGGDSAGGSIYSVEKQGFSFSSKWNLPKLTETKSRQCDYLERNQSREPELWAKDLKKNNSN